MAMFDGIVPELSKIGHFKKFKSINSEIQDAKGQLLASGNKTMFWSNNIPSNLGTINEMESISIQIKAISLIDVTPSYSLTSGTLPPGLSLTPTGYISGMTVNLSHENTYTFIISANDNQTTISKQFSLTVNAVNDPITWITASALGDMTDTYISIQLSAYDPDSTVTFSIVSGNLPVGVSLSSSGLISGPNPRDNQTYTFTVRATDGDNPVDREFSFLAFNEAPAWITASDLGTVSGISFSKTLSASDNDSGNLVYSLSLNSTLPSGVNLSNTGILSGTNPLTNTTHYFDVVVSDGVNTVTKSFYFYSFNASPTWNTTSDLGRFNTNTINIQLSASDSEGEVLTYAVVAGSLPPGLTLSNSGLLSGNNPYSGATAEFTVSVSDRANSVNRTFSISFDVASGEAIYTAVGNYSFTVPYGVTEIDALAVAGSTGFTTVGTLKATKGSTSSYIQEYRAPPGTVSLTASCYGSNGFVIGSSDGNIYKLEEPGLWFRKTVKVMSSSPISTMRYINGVYYAFGSGQIASSSDGLSWGLLPSINITVFSVDYNSNVIVAVGSSGGIIYSNNGMTSWNTATSPFGTTNIYCVMYGNGKFVAAGAGGKIATSVDGISWTIQVSNTTAILGEGYLFANGKFILSKSDGNALVSTDGIVWTVDTNIPYCTSFSYSASFGYVFMKGNLINKSIDLVTWIKKSFSSDSISSAYNVISYRENMIIFVAGVTPSVYISNDGGNTIYNLMYTSESYAVTYNSVYDENGTEVASYNTTSIISYSSSGLGTVFAASGVNSIACDLSGNTIVFGTNSTGTGHYVSTDRGCSWTKITFPPYSMVSWSGKTVKFIFFKGYWVAIVTSDITYAFYVSTDLINWTGYGTASSTGVVAKVINDILFIETGTSRYYSLDGLNWTITPAGFSPTGYYDGKYYQYNSTTSIKYTTGISSTFTTINLPLSLYGGTTNLSAVYVTKHGKFVLVNNSPLTNARGVYISSDNLSTSTRLMSDIANSYLAFNTKGELILSGSFAGMYLDKNNSYLSIINPKLYYVNSAIEKNGIEIISTTTGAVKITSLIDNTYWIQTPLAFEVISFLYNTDVLIASRTGLFSHSMDSKFTKSYAYDATLSTVRSVYVFNNKCQIAHDSSFVSIDLSSSVITTTSMTGYVYDNIIEFNGALYATRVATTSSTTLLIYKSTDGASWSLIYTPPTPALPVGVGIKRLVIKDGILHLFLTSGNTTYYTTQDGITWVANTMGVAILYNDIVYTGGYWVTARTNVLRFSNDLTTWTSTTFSEYSLAGFKTIVPVVSSEKTSFYVYGNYSSKLLFEVVPKGTLNSDATIVKVSSEGFSLTDPTQNGNYGKLSGVAGYKNNIPVTPQSVLPVSIPSLDGAVRIIWGTGRDYPSNAS